MNRSLVLAGLVVVLAGCGSSSSASPGTLPPVSAQMSAAPSPVVSVQAVPSPTPSLAATPITEQEVERSAGEIARHWVEVLNEAYTTLDTTELKTLSTPDCQTCKNYVNGMEHARSVGERWVGGQLLITDVVPAPPAEGVTDTEVLVSYKATAFYVLEASGRQSRQQPAEERAALQVMVSAGPGERLVTEAYQL